MGSSGRPSRSWRRLRARQARRGSDSFLRTLTLTRTDQNTSIVQPRSVTPHLPSSQPWISSIQSESKVSLCIISNTKSPQYLTTILAITKYKKIQFPFWYIGDILIGYTWCSNYMDVYRSVTRPRDISICQSFNDL